MGEFFASRENLWYLILILLVAAAGSFFMFTRRRPKPDTQSYPASFENVAIEELKYEERIKRFLLSSGGQASQSDIIKEIGLSKSRVSTILSQMKEKGEIIKIKNGSGNLIRIVNK